LNEKAKFKQNLAYSPLVVACDGGLVTVPPSQLLPRRLLLRHPRRTCFHNLAVHHRHRCSPEIPCGVGPSSAQSTCRRPRSGPLVLLRRRRPRRSIEHRARGASAAWRHGEAPRFIRRCPLDGDLGDAAEDDVIDVFMITVGVPKLP
jgi:hypothetical protein